MGSWLLREVYTTPYLSKINDLVEWFKLTLKSMLNNFVSETSKEWDKWLSYLLFAYSEVPQASTGYLPFNLLGPLGVLKDIWEDHDNQRKQNISCILKMGGKTIRNFYYSSREPATVPAKPESMVWQESQRKYFPTWTASLVITSNFRQQTSGKMERSVSGEKYCQSSKSHGWNAVYPTARGECQP